MLLVALTGGIGSGKSTVAAGLAGRGAVVVDADRIARAVVEPGTPALAAIAEHFGSEVLCGDGSLDRPALAAVVFSDPRALADLNAITHPAIGAEVLGRVAAAADGPAPVVLDVPLLDERTVALYRPAAVVVVDTPEDDAVRRLVDGRGFTEADARARVAAQATRQERRALIDLVGEGRVVDNSGDRAALEIEVDRVWGWITTLVDLAPPGAGDEAGPKVR